ncbi:MAG: helix-turn-helix domain-containing protein [Actinomycetota bacterium]|nr:helix-turn-helix domain-containing protein [Actinomycetota bacterium]
MKQKLRAVSKDLGSQAEVARVLGVSRSRVSRWLRDEQPDLENQRKIEGLEFVLGRLLRLLEPSSAVKFLTAYNPALHDFRPVDLLAQGRVGEVLAAIQLAEGQGYA